MRLFRVLYLAILITLLAGLAFAAFIFMTPVTQENFDMRVTAMCEARNLAAQANGQFKLTSLAVRRLSCSCVESRLTAQNGMDNAVRLAETTRLLFMNSMRSKLSGQSVDFGGFNINDIGKIQSFFSGLENACAAKT